METLRIFIAVRLKPIIFATPRRIFANAPWKSCVWPSSPPGSGVFTSLSIALVAVYFGFSYLGELNFGHYGAGVTLMAGFLTLILAPEFSSRYVTGYLLPCQSSGRGRRRQPENVYGNAADP